jgi:1-deoxy-D-xylulose-5-phosphate reductoisomerase
MHPQSIVHSMVEYKDGSTIAQASPPNMKGPIALAINYPQRTVGATSAIDWSSASTWNFAPIDHARFPAVNLARHCGTVGGALPAIFNASNEEAVAAFISGRIKFTDIIATVEEMITQYEGQSLPALRDLADVSAIEQDARIRTEQLIAKVAS